jgi:hypothetical protein
LHSAVGAVVGGGVGSSAGLLGGVGVAVAGTAFGVPAIGVALLGAAGGAAVGSRIGAMLRPKPSIAPQVVVIGLATVLAIYGIKRIMSARRTS